MATSKGDPRFHAVLKEIAELHDRKQDDYGKLEDPLANFRGALGWGIPAWVGALVRAGDKIIRLQRFARDGNLTNENAEDSLLDLAVYAIIALVLFREGRQNATSSRRSTR